MESREIKRRLAFLRQAEQLKNTLRSGRTSTGRLESAAEHTWRLCLMALTFADQFPEVNLARLLKICLVHDLGEAIHGDIPAPQQAAAPAKAGAERDALLQLLVPLPLSLQAEFTALWDEYEAADTPEARLAKALDKLETILQHNQGRNEPHFDYRFNLAYGQQYTADDARVAAMRAILDAETARLADEQAARAQLPERKRRGSG